MDVVVPGRYGCECAAERGARQAAPSHENRGWKIEDGLPRYTNHFVNINEMVGEG